MNAVIYARYSSDSQREESIEGQIRECTEYARRNNITILNTYVDRALSARSADRPEFQRMIKDAEKELFEIVLVWKLDRFSRDRYDSAYYKHILKKHGIKVVSAKENISEGPEGIILESMLEGMAEYYSVELSQKIKRGQMENALKGKNNGGQVTLGYRTSADGVLEIDPKTAPIVKEIFQRYDDGELMKDIVDSLNSRGLLTAAGKPFRIASLGTVLKNRKYLGEYHYGTICIPDKLPVIIEKDQFERVQQRMESNRHAPAKAKADEEYLLTTKLFCGKCGKMLTGESGTSRTRAKHYYYKCAGAKHEHNCKLKAIKKQLIERAAVIITVDKVLSNDEMIERVADSIVKLQSKEDTTIPALREQLKECEKGIENMLNAIQAGVLTPSTKERLDQLESRRSDLNISIMQAELTRPKYTKRQIVEWISQFKHGDPNDLNYQKQIIDIFLNSIYVYDDRYVFTYNFHGGTETIPREAVEEAFGSDLTHLAPQAKGHPVGWLFCLWMRMSIPEESSGSVLHRVFYFRLFRSASMAYP
ncbi:MAG: recombinase family protein, partial [Clostridiales bacterium]|nr:recombinase family protein [Clostridiales bacterium]